MRNIRENWRVWVAAAALGLCYAPVIAGLVSQWRTDEDMSHGFLVPLCIGWVVWRERDRWLALTPRPSVWGFAVLFGAAAMHILSAGGGGLFMGAVAMVLSVIGAILALGGTSYLVAWAFPLALTVFMLPKLAVVYNDVTLPLQLAATSLAAGMLRVTGAQVAVDGNILQVGGQSVAVEQACDGLRFLLSLGLLAVMFGWFHDPRKPWMRWALLAAVVPTAMAANALRVASAARLATIDPSYAEGLFHLVSGALVFAFCLPTLALFKRILDLVDARLHHA